MAFFHILKSDKVDWQFIITTHMEFKELIISFFIIYYEIYYVSVSKQYFLWLVWKLEIYGLIELLVCDIFSMHEY